MLNRRFRAEILLKEAGRLLVFSLILLSVAAFVLGDDQSTTGTKKLEIKATGNLCREVVAQVCIIGVGDTLTIEVTATVTPPSEPVYLAAVDLPSEAQFTPVSGFGTVASTFRFTPTTTGTYTVKFRATSGELTVSLSVTIDVAEEAGIPIDGVTDPDGITPVIELPPLVVGTVQQFIVNLIDCKTQESLSNHGVTITPTMDPDTGKIESLAIYAEGYVARVVTELIEQTITIPVGVITIQIILYTATDGPLITITIPNLGTVQVGTICLEPVEPDIEVPTRELDFGQVPVGESREEHLVIENVGDSNLTIESVSWVRPSEPSPFTLPPITRFTLGPGAVTTIPITFTPQEVGRFTNQLVIRSTDPDEGTLTFTVVGEGYEEVTAPCTLIVKGRVADSSHNYPVSFSKVWLFILRDGERLPLEPLSSSQRRPNEMTYTKRTNESSFDGREFASVDQATYEFRTQWEGDCPPRVVVVSLLWYYENSLIAVSSENPIDDRFVPIYLAQFISRGSDPLLEQVDESARATWRRTDSNEYTADPVDFLYGSEPLAQDSAKVVGAGGATSEAWHRKGVNPDTFMNSSAHFYFWAYKAVRYFESLREGLDPVLVSMFTNMDTSCMDSDNDEVQFGDLSGGAGPRLNADAQVFINIGDSLPPWSGDKPDNNIWHEMGHYWWLQIYGKFIEGKPDPNNNHGGWDNGSTTDSLQEGFAEFTSMLISEHYGDPKPYMYLLSGDNTNLELDKQLWGPFMALLEPDGTIKDFSSLDPSDEEFAIAGLLWDLHDGGDLQYMNVRELKTLGVISTQINVEDVMTLSDAEIFGHFIEGESTGLNTLKDLYHVLSDAYPQDSDGDGVTDVGEIFIAHGAFADVNPRNLKHDQGEAIGESGTAHQPNRPVRHDKPPLPQAYLVIRLVDETGAPVPLDGAVMHVDIRFADPFSYYDYSDVRPLNSHRVYFVMPTNFYSPIAYLTVEVPSQGRSEPLVLTGKEYWRLFLEAGEAGQDYLLEHTFVLVNKSE